MAEIVIVAIIKVKEGSEAEAEQSLRKAIDGTHADDEGCLRYALHRSMLDPQQFVMIEKWASQEALDAHGKSPHLAGLMPLFTDLAAETPQLLVLEPMPAGDVEKGAI